MSPVFTRREVLAAAAGLTAGAVLSPAPFTLLGDSAIWTQNWSWRPRAAPGRLTRALAHCTRCAAACPLSVRLCDGRPVGVAPVVGRAAFQGPPCAAGLLVHQLRFHPARLTTAAARARDHASLNVAPAAAVDLLAQWLRDAHAVAFVDGRPGRAESELYRAIARARGGRYAALEGDAPALELVSRAAGGLPMELDLSRARTLLSVGAPLADGFSAPGALSRLKAARARAGQPLHVIHADSLPSRTAMWADVWLPIGAGSEAVLAFGLLHELFASGQTLPGAGAIADLEALRRAAAPFTPEVTAPLTGVAAERLRGLTAELLAGPGTLVLSGHDAGAGPLGSAGEVAVAALDVLLGAVGPDGPVRPRASGRPLMAPIADRLRDIPEHSVDLLVCDLEESGRALPWAALERTLAAGGQLVLLSSHPGGLAHRASLTLPRLQPFEAHADATLAAPLPHGYVVSAPFVAPPEACPDGVELVARAAVQAGLLPSEVPLTAAGRVRRRIETLHDAGVGEVVGYADGRRTPVARFGSPAELESALAQGVWLDDEKPAASLPRLELERASGEPLEALALRALERSRAATGLALVATGWRGAASGAPLSPVADKAMRDAPVRESAHEAWVSLATAKAAGLADGASAKLETRRGAMPVVVKADAAIPDGVVAVAAVATGEDLGTALAPTPGVLELFEVERDGSWRLQGVRLMEG